MNADPRIIPVGEELPSMNPQAGRAEKVTGTDGKVSARRKQSTGAAVRRRFGLLNAVADEALPRFRGRADFAAWLLLYRHAKPDGTVTASIADLRRHAGCSDSAMRHALKRLQLSGLVERIKRGTLAGGPSVWRLLTPDGDRP